jgi:jasmonate ZIM domain-containing protein
MKMAMEVTASNGGRIVRGDAFAGNLAKGSKLLRTSFFLFFLMKPCKVLLDSCHP